jgi:hypothetical protein
MSFSASQLPHLYSSLGISVDRLGVVMLRFEGSESLVDPSMGLKAEHLYESPVADRKYLRGEPHVGVSHSTLLYGLLPGVRPEHVQEVMQGWEPPIAVTSSAIEVFHPAFPKGDPDHQAYGCLVALLDPNEEMLDAHKRLSLLPHIDTFPEYKPHVSLAYIRADQVDHWQWALEAKQHVFAVDTTTDARGLMGALWDGDVKAEVAL